MDDWTTQLATPGIANSIQATSSPYNLTPRAITSRLTHLAVYVIDRPPVQLLSVVLRLILRWLACAD